MSIIKLTPGGDVVTKAGLPACACCTEGSCSITWNTSVFDGQSAGNPWVDSLNGSRIRFNVEDSGNCGGENDQIQTGVATATITAGGTDTWLGFSFSGLAEEEATGFENISFYLNGFLVASATSPGTIGGNTCVMGPAVATYHIPPPYFLPALSVNTLEVQMTTGDASYHVGAYYQADFDCAAGPPDNTICMLFNDAAIGEQNITLTGSLASGSYSGVYDPEGLAYTVAFTWNDTLDVWEFLYQGVVLNADTDPTSVAVITGVSGRYDPAGALLDYQDINIFVDAEVLQLGTCIGCFNGEQTELCVFVQTYFGEIYEEGYYTLTGSLQAGSFTNGTITVTWNGTNWVGTHTASATTFTNGMTTRRCDLTGIDFGDDAGSPPTNPWWVFVQGFDPCPCPCAPIVTTVSVVIRNIDDDIVDTAVLTGSACDFIGFFGYSDTNFYSISLNYGTEWTLVSDLSLDTTTPGYMNICDPSGVYTDPTDGYYYTITL